jgi:PilX N-terminal
MSHRAILVSDTESTTMTPRGIRGEHGIALVIVLLVTTLLSALGLALTLMTSTERSIAAGYSWSTETYYAAEAGLERTLTELSLVTDWSDLLGGLAQSTFVDGSPGPRALGTGAQIDLRAETELLNCGHLACSAGDMAASTNERPWGRNNPVWHLYAHGPIAALSASESIDSRAYVAVWISDDPLESDDQPLVDGDESTGPNAGRGVLQIRAHAYGPAGAKRMIEVTLRREATRIRVLSWREIRR